MGRLINSEVANEIEKNETEDYGNKKYSNYQEM